MRKAVLSILIVALLLATCGVAPARAEAPQARPLAVVCFAGYDALMADINLVGELSGRPELRAGLEGMLSFLTQGKGLAGVDKSRPWGAMIKLNGDQPTGVACLPIDDLDAFEELLKPYIGQIDDQGDGVYKVDGKGPGQTVFTKYIDGWLFVADKPENLAALPADPGKLLGPMAKQYDLAVRVNLRAIPAEQRKAALAEMKSQFEREMGQQPGEDDEIYAIRKAVGTKALQAITTIMKDVDRVTFGVKLNNDTSSVIVDLGVAAKKGSKTAAALAGLATPKTAFAGFRVPGALFSANLAATCPHVDSGNIEKLIGMIRSKANEQIDEHAPDADQATAAKEILGEILEVAGKTLASGKADGAMSLIVKPEAATLVAGRYCANGLGMESALGKLVDAVRSEHPDFVDSVLTTDVGEHEGVRMHQLSIGVPGGGEDRDKAVKLIGEKLDIVVGFAEEALYVAAGRNAMETLKKAISKSAADGTQEVAPLQLSLALGKVAKMVAELADGSEQQQAVKALEALGDAAGKDHVKLSILGTPRGVKLRLVAEAGVLKMAASGVGQ